MEQAQAEPVDLNAILSGLLKFRAPEWKAKGVEIKSQLAVKRAIVLGSPGQLEQVLLNLLVDAEKSAAEARDKIITVSSSLLAKRVLVEISYPLRSPDITGRFHRRRSHWIGRARPGRLPRHYREPRRRVPRGPHVARPGSLRY